jgi:hypothetical protein
LTQGIVPAGEEAQIVLYESDYAEETDLFNALRGVSERYKVEDFDLTHLKEHLGRRIKYAGL